MTVLEWLKASTRYTFEEQTFIKIALDRECDPNADVYGNDVTKRQRELMTADIIFTAVLLSPSNTASLSQSHNGYQRQLVRNKISTKMKKSNMLLGFTIPMVMKEVIPLTNLLMPRK